jgi:hypothetical protein
VQSRARWEHRRRSGADCLDDLAVVNSLQIDGGDAEVRVTELALYDVEWHALAGHLDGVRVSELMWRKAPGRRTKMLPRERSRSLSASLSASLMRSPARHSTTMSARVLRPYTVSPAVRITATISSTGGGSAG